jgi:acyl-CoA hydrolase
MKSETLCEKSVSESKTDHVEIVLLEHLNGFSRLFGGRLVEWIDVVAAVVARRHSNCNVTTASIDNLQFKEPAYLNDTVVLSGCVTYVGNTSMEVRVDTFVEKLTGEKNLINRAYLVLVALDEDENPVPVPRLILETEEEKLEWESGIRRHKLRNDRRVDNY